jgi:hypothetical protein
VNPLTTNLIMIVPTSSSSFYRYHLACGSDLDDGKVWQLQTAVCMLLLPFITNMLGIYM